MVSLKAYVGGTKKKISENLLPVMPELGTSGRLSLQLTSGHKLFS